MITIIISRIAILLIFWGQNINTGYHIDFEKCR